ncbi:vanadium-dependent haloperoxidase [Alkalihalobacterium sp. APHAB7]|uniref:vanadium-dependent haloperoxidase n=1 Tax=Alkalihalobacterium sp. APHAB7 TaxID=3402081 RepID=UPI003AAABE56
MRKPNYPLWTDTPYAGETHPPNDPVERYAGSWKTHFIKRCKGGGFETLDGRKIRFAIRHPNTINWDEQLKIVQREMENISDDRIAIVKYWGSGPPPKQWLPIADRLIDTYNVSAPRAARILSTLFTGLNDAFIVTWDMKYKLNVARPNQLDQKLATVICTPKHPAYPSGHATVSGAAAVILSYFFPAESRKIHALAEEAALSRLYGGIHFPVENEQGLRLGRQIGEIIVQQLRKDYDSNNHPIDTPYRQYKNAKLMPPPYEQVIPYNHDTSCSSLVIETETAVPKNITNTSNLTKPVLFI